MRRLALMVGLALAIPSAAFSQSWTERPDWARFFAAAGVHGTIAVFSGAVDRFWLDGGLRISAVEQIAFLRRLYRNALPFREEHQRLVKDILVIEAGRNYVLRAKTGWGARVKPQVGWWVGWVEWPDGPVFFALNIEMPRGGEDAPKREGIARAVLRSIDALPTAK